LLNSETISLALVRTVSGGGVGIPQSRWLSGFEPDAGKGILPRRKNEDHEGPRRGVDESGAEMVQTVFVYYESKIWPKSLNRQDRQLNAKRSTHSDEDQSTTPVWDCRISTRGGRDTKEISVALRDSRSSFVVKSYRSLRKHSRSPGALVVSPQVVGQQILAPLARAPEFLRCALGMSGMPYGSTVQRKRCS
jgi:hypothetical protein